MMTFRSRIAKISLAVLLLGVVGVAFWPDDEHASLADPNDAEQVALGATVYAENCASCHGAELEGQPDWRTPLPDGGLAAPPHDAGGHTWHHDDRLLFDYTQRGGQALIGSAGKSNMPGFGDRLSDAEIWAVLAYIKAQWPDEIRAAQAERNAAAGGG